MLNKVNISTILLCLSLFCEVSAQGKLITVVPQNPQAGALSNSLTFIHYGNDIHLLISENFKNFGSPSYSEWYLQKYDYSLNLIKEESIYDLPYRDSIHSYGGVGGGYLTDTNGFFIFVSNINNSVDKTLFQVRDESGTVIFNKFDFQLFDTHVLDDSRVFLHNILLKKDNRLHFFALDGASIASYSLDSLQTDLSNSIFVQADSLFINSRVVFNPQTGISTYHLTQYQNGLDTYYYVNLDSSLQFMDSLKVTAQDDFRSSLINNQQLLRFDSTEFDTISNHYQSKYEYRDFDGNLVRTVNSEGRIFYNKWLGPWKYESLIFGDDGSWSITSLEHLISTNPQGATDTTRASRLRYFDAQGVKQLDHLIFTDGLPISAIGTGLFNNIGHNSNGDFYIPLNSFHGSNSRLFRSFLLKIVSQGNSPLSVHLLTESKVVEVYPNPSKNWIKINTNEPGEKLKIKILDLQGQIVFNREAIADQRINISELPLGTYLMHLEGEKGAWHNNYKLIKL